MKYLLVDLVKKLITLVMLVEDKDLYVSICAPYRSSPDNHWCQPVSKHSRAMLKKESPPRDLQNSSLEDHLPQRHGILRNLHGFTRIWNCTSVKEITRETLTCKDMTRPSSEFTRRGDFSLREVADFDINGALVLADLTIEFRYKESTGSAREDYY